MRCKKSFYFIVCLHILFCQGFLSGIGKGLVGTVAKPMAGVFDLASGTAAAVRTSTETTVPVPPVVRLKRNCYGPGGVLAKYSKMASEGQDVLRRFNQGDPDEMLVYFVKKINVFV